jgi:hypothetical protein
MRIWFINFYAALFKRIIKKYRVSASFYENTFKKFIIFDSKPVSEFIFGFPSFSLAFFSSGTCHRWLSEQFSESQAAFGTSFGVIGGFLYATKSSFKEVSVGFLEFQKQKLHFYICSQKATKKFSNHQQSYKKYC